MKKRTPLENKGGTSRTRTRMARRCPPQHIDRCESQDHPYVEPRRRLTWEALTVKVVIWRLDYSCPL